jgi:benzylsuccinate CoA-transferase BbsE subunit
MLHPYRVLELTDQRGCLCGKVLADLGAEVIKIERPEGDSCRRMGPFYRDIPGPERSLQWFFYNQGKKSLTLNIETRDGQQLFKHLLGTSHFLVESFDPEYLDGLGLGYNVVSHLNPQIIMTSITPFGQAGPYSYYKAEDINLMAMGGFMYIVGEPDRPPLRISIDQAFLLAGAQAAAATLTAHWHRQRTREGQHVDVSAQHCIMSTLANVIPLWELSHTNLKRVGSFLSGRGAGGLKQRLLFACKDGSISYTVMGGPLLSQGNRAVVKWMDEEGMADDFIRGWVWEEYDMARATQEVQNRLEGYFARFFLTHTKADIYREGLERGFMVAPVSEPVDIIRNPQLQARGFWTGVEHPELKTNLTYPGTFYRSSKVSSSARRAPLIGEYNREIYEKELGISREEIIILKQAGII